MLRITSIESGNQHVILRLEGRICGPWVAELQNVCDRALQAGQSLDLNLSEVTFLDRFGIGLIQRLRSTGVRIIGCSPYVAEELRAASA